MARVHNVVRVNPSTWPGHKKHSRIGKKFDDCVKAVSSRGDAYDPEAVCAKTMRKRYGYRFQELSIRARRAAARARRNPVQEILQTHRVSAGALTLEWVDVDDGRWIDAKHIRGVRPPVEPGKHLIAPGAVILFIQHGNQTKMEFAQSVFIKHHHAWKFIQQTGPIAHATVDASGRIQMRSNISKADRTIFGMMLAYMLYEEKEHGAGARRTKRASRRRASYSRPPSMRAQREHAASVLGVSPKASHEEITHAFRKAVMIAHPDRGGTNEQIRAVVEARNLLSGGSRRMTVPRHSPSALC